VHADEAPGLSSTAASWVIEIDEVFVAISVSRPDDGLDLAQDAQLELEVLGGRLDHQVAAGQRVLVWSRP
jgi:hypothetical protein